MKWLVPRMVARIGILDSGSVFSCFLHDVPVSPASATRAPRWHKIRWRLDEGLVERFDPRTRHPECPRNTNIRLPERIAAG